jgi:hypothetical protein
MLVTREVSNVATIFHEMLRGRDYVSRLDRPLFVGRRRLEGEAGEFGGG